MKKRHLKYLCLIGALWGICTADITQAQVSKLKAGFVRPPDSAKPGVYWYFMDGNMNARSMTADLESMKKAGIANLVFLEVNVGIPRGQVDFLSLQWQDLFAHAVKEAKRLGIAITLGIGPGWTGSGGPWVPASQSMLHLVSSTVKVEGGAANLNLPIPKPKNPFFGEGAFTPELKKQWNDYYEDVAVLAYPTPTATQAKIIDIDEKALFTRAPYSSAPGVKQFLPYVADHATVTSGAAIDRSKVIDLTNKLSPDGKLNWTAPAGNWTIMRLGKRNNGAITRPAPYPGLGFEADKMDTVALNSHLDNYVGRLLKKTGIPNPKDAGGLKMLHMDSWEMGAQNWTGRFREEFKARRGYDPLPYYPVYAGDVVDNTEISERFLWDLRQTAQQLVLQNHAVAVKNYAHKMGMKLSIEPYDMNPTADLELGATADVPMAEFWSKGLGFNSSFSCIEATSIGHVNGVSLIPAEAFTAQDNEGWKQYPGNMKNQGDWAFATGINRFVYHTFQNQFLPDSLRPGATMGPYGVHWDRNQTWWPMAHGYHDYISRSCYMLQQGNTVADILYLTPEGSPHVFRPPSSAMNGDVVLPDRKGYNFDGCAPGQLYKASVKDGKIVFPGGASYRILVLPAVPTMTPALLKKISTLIAAGATVVGAPPSKSPSLTDYPACDAQLTVLAQTIWGDLTVPATQTTHAYGKGKVIWGGELSKQINTLYPEYDLTAAILKSMNISQDFTADGSIRYTHRRVNGSDVYFVSNRTASVVDTIGSFRSRAGRPQLWNAITGEARALPEFSANGQLTKVPLKLEPYQSFFIVFDKTPLPASANAKNFPDQRTVVSLAGSWQASFDPKWGGPKSFVFDDLKDWTTVAEEGVKYYSGTAVYRKSFDLDKATLAKKAKISIDLGEVYNLARVKLNGKDHGILWAAPWTIDLNKATLKEHNELEIEVVNLWPNRLIGDERLPDDGIKNGRLPDWVLQGKPRPTKRVTFSTYKFYNKDSPLLKSGLIGPVTIKQEN
ncbi:glycosyl hydrolase [Mucilaginibacter myungsuensis]|uniref:Glycosyl hydrolase n=1 Tax=Mucilaginibacter myungsuensis TaxID=649104 RepID=A0A929KYD4_9SPHI|nr:glycosyl hydrolase [Mucilaginibacter myungsuensis]MBE9660885.1 glycosyl hydrolase [Mucilaginibacter myungsuensis]MDN3600932.1 glycosyl hydrolase [Mucilaginibacter myungsuensis]